MTEQPHVSQAMGYFHWPPVWIGDAPVTQDKHALNEVVFRATLTCGIAIKFLRKGIFIFDFSSSSFGYIDPRIDLIKGNERIKEAIYRRITILNIHLVCLYSAFAEVEHDCFDKMILTPVNVIAYRSLDDVGGISPESHVPAQMHYLECENGVPKEFLNWKNEREATISIDIVKRSIDLLEQVLQHKCENATDLVHLYARSCKAYEDHDFGLSLITSWTITETLVSFLWATFLEKIDEARTPTLGNEKFINKDRRKKLIDGRDYSASTIIEILSLAGVIPYQMYKELNKVRSLRNAWIHNVEPIGSDDAREAVFLAGDMLRFAYGLEYRVPLSTSMMF